MSCATGVVLAAFCWARADGPFRVLPYLQNPAGDAITVMWFSEASTAGQYVNLKSTCKKPALLPLGLRNGQIDA
ncbi:MAG TPA: hypothetical protein PLH01_04865 [Kiritimatiellia bacterium]|nr:hypothetical protein [Kiritimatiellia bacterium]